jgi:uncharacterized protein (DUF488 family)
MTDPAAFDLFTIGHSNLEGERFIALLSKTNVTVLVDVRSIPYSRRYPQFSRDALAARLGASGIVYVSLGNALGGRPQDPALMCDGVADYEAMARAPAFRAGLEHVIAGNTRQRICLMCAEREPLDCHRCLLVGRALSERGLRVGHILNDGAIEDHVATEDRLMQLAGEKEDLFEDHATRLAAAYRRRTRAVAYRAKEPAWPRRAPDRDVKAS